VQCCFSCWRLRVRTGLQSPNVVREQPKTAERKGSGVFNTRCKKKPCRLLASALRHRSAEAQKIPFAQFSEPDAYFFELVWCVCYIAEATPTFIRLALQPICFSCGHSLIFPFATCVKGCAIIYKEKPVCLDDNCFARERRVTEEGLAGFEWALSSGNGGRCSECLDYTVRIRHGSSNFTGAGWILRDASR
jgi:hypothetical protein